jgi:DNA-binding NarL/FixJ family response regulator
MDRAIQGALLPKDTKRVAQCGHENSLMANLKSENSPGSLGVRSAHEVQTRSALNTPDAKVISGAAIFTDCAWEEIGRSLGLSGRERQIVRGIFDDQTEGAIAADLTISPRTVHAHVERLHRKLRVVDRVGLVLRIINEFLKLTTAPGTLLPPICAMRAAGKCPRLPRAR